MSTLYPAIAILSLSLLAVAQQVPTLTAQPNTIYVSAEGKYEAPPDTAVLQFNIAAQEDSSSAAYERASKAAEQIREILRSNGIDPKQAHIGFFSLAPVYDWRTPKRKLIGYRVSSSVELKLKDFAKVAPIVQQLANIDVTENQSLNYTLDDMDAAKIKAVDDALHRARGEAAAVAQASGRTLGELSYASVDTFERVPIVVGRMSDMAPTVRAEAAPPPPTAEFSPQTISVTAHVNALFTLK